MADYGYFNGLDYDETFPARYAAALIPNGVYSGELQAVPYGGMQVEVTRGRAWANGYFFDSSHDIEDTLITIPTADPTNPRTDVIVLRADLTNKLFGAVRISGTAGSNPVEPSIIRAGGIYDLKLAIVSVPAGTAEITSAMITDTRADYSVCGYTGGFITQTLQSQIDAINNSKGQSDGFAGLGADGIVPLGQQGITSGSNSNGSYIKQPDGTMVCYKTVSWTGNVATAYGALYTSGSVINLGSFAAAFTATPTIGASIALTSGSGPSGWLDALKGVSASSAGSTGILRPTSLTGGAYTIHVRAVGKWK